MSKPISRSSALWHALKGSTAMNTDDYTQSVEAVIAQERAGVFPVPLRAKSYFALFEAWVKANSKVMRELEMVALGIHQRGLRVSTKSLSERQRYEGRTRAVAVPYVDQYGIEHTYSINNTVTPLLARWLLKRHPDMRIETRKSLFDEPNRKVG